ncbi:MAG: ferritin family protein [Dehalococcoidales bacterium]|nr:ferritin family protein [Dehalococcoidales bacterium]
MQTEQNKTLEVLKIAIQMEIDGKTYYLKISQESTNELGKELLQALAAEEDIHRRKFEEIYKAIEKQKGWPAVDFQPDEGRGLRSVFARALENQSASTKPLSTELDAIETAMAMENKTFDFYKNQEQKATYDAERNYYQSLCAQERHHYLVLLDYYEYLKDPAWWFAKTERPSLDGG